MSDFDLFEWNSEYKHFREDFGIDVVDRIAERCGLPLYEDDVRDVPDLEYKLEELRRVHADALEAEDLLQPRLDAEFSFPPVSTSPLSPTDAFARIDAMFQHSRRVREDLIVMGVECGLDVLEDALNSGVPLDNIV